MANQPLLKTGLHPDASDALRKAGVGAGRVGQTIGNAAASAGTHAPDGSAGGHQYTAAVDLRIRDLNDSQIHSLLGKLSEAGFAGYYRNPGHDGWPGHEIKHVHAVFAGCSMKRALRNQVHDYLHGKNGLASHTAYTFFQPGAAAQSTIRDLFLAHNQAVGVLDGDDDSMLDKPLPADDAETSAEYGQGHSHEALESDEPMGDDLASTL